MKHCNANSPACTEADTNVEEHSMTTFKVHYKLGRWEGVQRFTPHSEGCYVSAWIIMTI